MVRHYSTGQPPDAVSVPLHARRPRCQEGEAPSRNGPRVRAHRARGEAGVCFINWHGHAPIMMRDLVPFEVHKAFG